MGNRPIPAHLRRFVSKQVYENYTPINHAVWRYVMRQNYHFHKERAHEAYREGLARSGIVVDHIPSIEEMNACLLPYGWGAVPIDGLIPGVAFFDFQAHGFLPIAAEIRRLENIAYTPAPDIIHEAAGHAPILCDEKYAEYVRIFGRIGAKALATKEEHDAFLAARHHSIVMEDPASTPEMIEAAEKDLAEKLALCTEVSEATQLSRLYWWTVEYGLIGDLESPRIYGAGLLSSLEEGRLAVSSKVKKLPFDLEVCIQTHFDVTRPQPQLFVCRDFDELIEAVERFSERMAFKRGGTESLVKAIRSGDTATAVYSSGLAVSGTFRDILRDARGEAIYLFTTGPTALAYRGKELPNQGKETHPDGFGAPIGRLAEETKPLEAFTKQDLSDRGWLPGSIVTLRFESGVVVQGRLIEPVFQQEQLLLLRFADCRVRYQDRMLFLPEYGVFDMPVGERIVSVYAGAEDPEKYFADEPLLLDSFVAKETKFTPLDHLYQTVRDIRDGKKALSKIPEVLSELEKVSPNDWLLRIEMLELLTQRQLEGSDALKAKIEAKLNEIAQTNEKLAVLIENGRKLAHVK